jgi:hypothetical protein
VLAEVTAPEVPDMKAISHDLEPAQVAPVIDDAASVAQSATGSVLN